MEKEYVNKCLEADDGRINVTSEFIERNKLKIDKNVAFNIVKEQEDMFGFDIDVALDYLTFAKAKQFLNKEYVEKINKGEEKWNQIIDINEATQDFLDYMVFAWMKARDERGLSASRSITKLSVWLKILSRPDLAELISRDDLYPQYGKPALRKVCEEMGIDCPNDIR